MKIDLTRFTQTLPCASKLFVIYQPLLGWQLKRIIQRVQLGFLSSFDPAMRQIAARMRPWSELDLQNNAPEFGISRIVIASTDALEEMLGEVKDGPSLQAQIVVRTLP